MTKLRFLFVLRSVNSFAMSMAESLPVLSLSIFKTVRLLNRSWFILERSHVFSLLALEKDLSPSALVAGFTRISLHNVITSFIISRSGLPGVLSTDQLVVGSEEAATIDWILWLLLPTSEVDCFARSFGWRLS